MTKDVIVWALFLVLFISACNVQDSTNTIEVDETVENTQKQETNPDWRTAELTDAVTGETFRISDFEGKQVLIESFAVWCPTCRKQQEQVKEQIEQNPDSNTVHIALDMDPNEDINLVKDHALKNEFDWHFVVAPKGVAQNLIQEFGVGIVNVPSSPMLLVCEDGSVRMLGRGVKSPDVLNNELAKGC